MTSTIYQHSVEWEYSASELPPAYAHVLEHLLCWFLVNHHGAMRVTGRTTAQKIRIDWVEPHALVANDLLDQLPHVVSATDLVREQSAIAVELNWLAPMYHTPNPCTVSLFDLFPGLSFLMKTRERIESCRPSEAVWHDIQQQYKTTALRIGKFQRKFGQRYPDGALFQRPEGLVLCEPIGYFSGLNHTVLYPIHRWHWVLSALSQYASTISQRMRSAGSSFYSYGYGVFPCCGTWYLYLTGLHKTTASVFFKQLLLEIDRIISIQQEIIKLHREVEVNILIQLSEMSQTPALLSRMLVNSHIDFKNTTEDIIDRHFEHQTPTHFFSPESLTNDLVCIRETTQRKLRIINND